MAGSNIFSVENYLTGQETREAMRWDTLAQSNTGQQSLFHAAKAGDSTALNYLLVKSGRAIYHAFVFSIGGDISSYRATNAIKSGEYDTFLAIAYQVLAQGKASPYVSDLEVYGSSPLDVFPHTTFPSSTNLIDKFQLYFSSALKHSIRQGWFHQLANGLTGVQKASVVKNKTLLCFPVNPLPRDSFDNSLDGKRSLSSELDSFTQSLDTDPTVSLFFANGCNNLDKWKQFCFDPRIHRGTDYSIADILLEALQQGADFSVANFAAIRDTHRPQVYRAISKVPAIMDEYYIDKDDFCHLLRTYGSLELSEHLQAAISSRSL